MIAGRLAARGFRNLDDATALELDPGLNLLTGENGAGKTNTLDALYFALTGASCRTSRVREVIGFGAPAARAEAEVRDPGGGVSHTLAAAIGRDGERNQTLDGAEMSTPADAWELRPAVIVFIPDRLDLVKGAPTGRRAHLDRLGEALRPSAAGVRREYGAVLAQRNSLLAQLRARGADGGALDAWDESLARAGAALSRERTASVEAVAGLFEEWAATLGLEGEAAVAFRPRVEGAGDAEVLRAALAERRVADLERGHTTTGPHHDELRIERGGRELRRYGSQGEQRLALLALLMSERAAIAAGRGRMPLVLLDDVLSELDPGRRQALAEVLLTGGQSLLTTTEPRQLPVVAGASFEVRAGVVATLGERAR